MINTQTAKNPSPLTHDKATNLKYGDTKNDDMTKVGKLLNTKGNLKQK